MPDRIKNLMGVSNVFKPCRDCTDPLHCGSWNSCYRTDPDAPRALSPATHIAPGPATVTTKNGQVIGQTFPTQEDATLSAMAGLDGIASRVADQFHKRTTTSQGTPLFTRRGQAYAILRELVLDALQEVKR